jgi:hypothetical protein
VGAVEDRAPAVSDELQDPWATKVAETGSTRASAPFSNRPPAMPNTPEIAAVTNAAAMMKAPVNGSW